MFSIKKNKTTSTLWHVLIPMSGVTLLASATGGMSGDIFNLLVTQELGYTEAYSVAGEMGFGWWLVEHYLPYHIDCPNSCGLGESTRGG